MSINPNKKNYERILNTGVGLAIIGTAFIASASHEITHITGYPKWELNLEKQISDRTSELMSLFTLESKTIVGFTLFTIGGIALLCTPKPKE